MEDKNIIFCEKCYKANEPNRTICINCGATLKRDNINYQNKKINTQSITNSVSHKFSLLVGIMQIIGYLASFIAFVTFLTLEETGFAFLSLICGTIVTWLSTLFFEAVAEGLQLLQDIKDKILNFDFIE